MFSVIFKAACLLAAILSIDAKVDRVELLKQLQAAAGIYSDPGRSDDVLKKVIIVLSCMTPLPLPLLVLHFRSRRVWKRP